MAGAGAAEQDALADLQAHDEGLAVLQHHHQVLKATDLNSCKTGGCVTPIVLFNCIVEQYELLLLLLQVTQYTRLPIYSVSSAMCKTDCPSSLLLMTFCNHQVPCSNDGSQRCCLVQLIQWLRCLWMAAPPLMTLECSCFCRLAFCMQHCPTDSSTVHTLFLGLFLFCSRYFCLALGIFLYLSCPCFTCFLAVDLHCCCSCLACAPLVVA